MSRLALLAAALLACAFGPAAAQATMTTQRFEFVSNGKRLVGRLDQPTQTPAKALIIIVPGYGRTDVARGTSWQDLRSRFTRLGIATALWDKPGCGESEGVFDPDQPVESSAREVLDAAAALRRMGAPGAGKIGLWGVSRAGWIAPLALTQDPRLAFWISVSGTDALENFPYLLESNLRIEGRSEAEVAKLTGEWRRGFEISRTGGRFADYLAATQALRADPFWVYLTGGAAPTEAAFLAGQKPFLSGAARVDPRTGLMIYVPHFAAVLSRVNVPVLAIFGEKDRNVDWRATRALYARTLGRNPRARLTVRTFPDANHNLQRARTGGYREMMDMTDRQAAAGYYEAMEDWLRRVVLR